MRVLVINTQSVNHKNATGITLRSILNCLDNHDVMEIYMQPCELASDPIKIKSLRFPLFACFFRNIANKFFKNKDSSTSPTQNVSGQNLSKNKLRSKLIKRAIMMLDYEPVFITPKLLRAIKDFKPDCIYTLGNAIDAMKASVKISKEFNIPIIPHFMDNWPSSHRYGDKYKHHLTSTQKWLKKLYSRSNVAMVISEKMAEEYEERWKIPHIAIMNTVDVSKYICSSKSNKVRIFTYAGGLHLNRHLSLLSVAAIIDNINTEKNEEYELRIYSDTKSLGAFGNLFDKFSCVKLNPYVPHEEIKSVYEEADILIHIETFEISERDFIRYSLSTKISEYLSTGRPIILYAPDDIFVSEYIKKHNAGIVVSSEQSLGNSIDRILSEGINPQISKNAIELALNHHNDGSIRNIINSVFKKRDNYD